MQEELEMTAYAALIEISSEHDNSPDKWKRTLTHFFDELTNELHNYGVRIIGHIKGFLDLEDAGYCYFSNTGDLQKTKTVSEIKNYAKNGKITFNVIVYGLEEESIEEIVKNKVEIIEEELQAVCQIITKND
jgi:flagellar motor component MotA